MGDSKSADAVVIKAASEAEFEIFLGHVLRYTYKQPKNYKYFKDNPEAGDLERATTGAMHASRVAVYVDMLVGHYNNHHPDTLIAQLDRQCLMITAMCHAAGRDREKSRQIAGLCLLNWLLIGDDQMNEAVHAKVNEMMGALAEKDKNASGYKKPLLTQILQTAIALDVQRKQGWLVGDDAFDPTRCDYYNLYPDFTRSISVGARKQIRAQFDLQHNAKIQTAEKKSVFSLPGENALYDRRLKREFYEHRPNTYQTVRASMLPDIVNPTSSIFVSAVTKYQDPTGCCLSLFGKSVADSKADIFLADCRQSPPDALAAKFATWCKIYPASRLSVAYRRLRASCDKSSAVLKGGDPSDRRTGVEAKICKQVFGAFSTDDIFQHQLRSLRKAYGHYRRGLSMQWARTEIANCDTYKMLMRCGEVSEAHAKYLLSKHLKNHPYGTLNQIKKDCSTGTSRYLGSSDLEKLKPIFDLPDLTHSSKVAPGPQRQCDQITISGHLVTYNGAHRTNKITLDIDQPHWQALCEPPTQAVSLQI
jgi:hypothetical protein